MKQRIFLLAVLLCACITAANGQTFNKPTDPDPNGWYHNLEKYWWYRYRLVNDFMIIGPDCGMSIPAQRRENGNYWDTTGLKKLKWADATIDLGDYIAMLASEYKHLKNNHLDTSRTLMELYYALNAFERLDRNAESACNDIDNSYPCTQQDDAKYGNMLNGFFIRDDVPWRDNSFEGRTSIVTDHYDHFNRPGIRNILPVRGVESNAWSGRYRKSQADWGHSAKRMPEEESQDQLVQMAMGLTLVAAKLNGVMYNGENLGAKAAANLYRITDHVARYFNNWDIINPVTNKCVYGVVPDGNCNAGGAMAQDIARGLALTMDKWATPYGNTPNAHPIVTSTEGTYLNSLWQLEQTALFNNVADCGFWGTMAALSDSWQFKLCISPWPVQICYVKNSTYERVRTNGEAHDWGNPHLALIYRWLYGESGIYRPRQYQLMFDAAPGCGIHNYAWKVPNVDIGYLESWTGNNAIHEWNHRSQESDDNSDCNGLDYMTLYNLYINEDPKYQQMYFNAYYKTDMNVGCPNTFARIGTADHQLTLNYLEYLSTITKVKPGGYLTLRCAKVIDLKPGFDAQQGSVFTAFVQDYQVACGKDIYDPGEAFHHALINGNPNTHVMRTTGDVKTDSSYYLDYPPDGEPFMPEDMPEPAVQDTTTITCEMQHAYFNQLVQQVYDSGDPDAIAYMDTVIIPNATFPACDPVDENNSERRVLINNAAQIQVFPNPNNGRFTISVSDCDNYTICVRDMMGHEVFSDYLYAPDKSKKITLSVVPGNYIISVAGSKYCTTQKITVTP